MKVVAYARRISDGPTVADQLAQAEGWARANGHDVRRFVRHELQPQAVEFPPRIAVMRACERSAVDGVVVVDLSVLGPHLGRTISKIDKAGARLFVVGRSGKSALDLWSPELQLAAKVAEAVYRERACAPRRRTCAPRIFIDVREVRELQAQGARLQQVAEHLQCSRSSIVRALRRDRDRTAEENGPRA